MSLNGIRSDSPDTAYIRELERTIKRLTERIDRLELDRRFLSQRQK